MKQVFVFLFALAMSSQALAYHMEGTVFCDANLDGVFDDDESPLAGVTVQATKGDFLFTAVTDANGYYSVDVAIIGRPAVYGIWEVSISDGLGEGASIVDPASGIYSVDFSTEVLQLTMADFAVNDPSCGNPEPYCGDGILDIDNNEMCDDGNMIDGDGCSAVCMNETFCGDGNLDSGEICDDGNILNGDGCSAVCDVESGGEGCTPGYWKQAHHFGNYPESLSPDTLFVDAFGRDAFPGLTLLEVMKLRGGELKALGRHAVAALLNASSSDVDYDRSVDSVKASFVRAFDDMDYQFAKNVFETFNEQSCPLGRAE